MNEVKEKVFRGILELVNWLKFIVLIVYVYEGWWWARKTVRNFKKKFHLKILFPKFNIWVLFVKRMWNIPSCVCFSFLLLFFLQTNYSFQISNHKLTPLAFRLGTYLTSPLVFLVSATDSTLKCQPQHHTLESSSVCSVNQPANEFLSLTSLFPMYSLLKLLCSEFKDVWRKIVHPPLW